jgi:hypothetical protein
MATACAPNPALRVTKSIVTDPLTGGGNLQKVTAVDEDEITFAIVVEHVGPVGSGSVSFDVTDTFDPVFTGTYDLEDNPDSLPVWTRTNANDTTTPGVGNITGTYTLTPGQRISWLVDTIFSPAACTTLVTNVVTVSTEASCCGETDLHAAAQVLLAGTTPKVDPLVGWTAMELLYYLVESIGLPSRVNVANFINSCQNLGDIIGFDGEGGDGVALPILDALGDPTGLYGETSPGN